MTKLYYGKFERLPDEDRDLRPIGDLMHAWRLIGTQERYYCQDSDTFEPCRVLLCSVCDGSECCEECEGTGNYWESEGDWAEIDDERCGSCGGSGSCYWCRGKGYEYAPTKRSTQTEPVCYTEYTVNPRLTPAVTRSRQAGEGRISRATIRP